MFQKWHTCATLVSFVMNRHKQQQDETWDRFTRWTSSLLCFSIIMLSSSVVKLEFWVFRREQSKTEGYQYTMLSRCKRGDCLPTIVQSSPFPVRCRIPIWNLKRESTEKSVWAIGILFKYVYKCMCTSVCTSVCVQVIWSPPWILTCRLHCMQHWFGLLHPFLHGHEFLFFLRQIGGLWSSKHPKSRCTMEERWFNSRKVRNTGGKKAIAQ